jgi:hypothetical protein
MQEIRLTAQAKITTANASCPANAKCLLFASDLGTAKINIRSNKSNLATIKQSAQIADKTWCAAYQYLCSQFEVNKLTIDGINAAEENIPKRLPVQQSPQNSP